jgi:uncharacterized protein (TIGR03437 family)
VFNQDGILNSANNSATPGSIVILYATGQGVTNPPIATDLAALSPYPAPADSLRVTVGGQDAENTICGARAFDGRRHSD